MNWNPNLFNKLQKSDLKQEKVQKRQKKNWSSLFYISSPLIFITTPKGGWNYLNFKIRKLRFENVNWLTYYHTINYKWQNGLYVLKTLNTIHPKHRFNNTGCGTKYQVLFISRVTCIFFSFFFFFFLFFIGWRLITLQYCNGFCHTLTWISHGFTCIPHLDPASLD